MQSLLRGSLFAAARQLSPELLTRWVRSTLGGRHLCLCLHRVASERRPGELLPQLTIAPELLDALIETLLSIGPGGQRWLTVSFDDGYLDSARYLLSRAGRFPSVDWLYFVCPAKTESGIGFRWDLAELQAARGHRVDLQQVLDEDDPAENGRPELSAVARLPEFALADLETCREIARLSNAELGNHTNVHQRPSRLTPQRFLNEYRSSAADFERLFGTPRHFAFPFGVPGVDFSKEQVAALNEDRCFLWSTEPRPFGSRERRPGAVIPRFAVDGTRNLQEQLFWIAAHSLGARQGSR
jgi:hypothetical protein